MKKKIVLVGGALLSAVLARAGGINWSSGDPLAAFHQAQEEACASQKAGYGATYGPYEVSLVTSDGKPLSGIVSLSEDDEAYGYDPDAGCGWESHWIGGPELRVGAGKPLNVGPIYMNGDADHRNPEFSITLYSFILRDARLGSDKECIVYGYDEDAIGPAPLKGRDGDQAAKAVLHFGVTYDELIRRVQATPDGFSNDRPNTGPGYTGLACDAPGSLSLDPK